MPNPWDYASKTRNEAAEQTALFMWAAVAQRYGAYVASCPAAYTTPGWADAEGKAAIESGNDSPIPELEWLHAINNNAGLGDAIRGAQAKAQGVKAGVPDLCLPVPKSVEREAWGRLTVGACGLYVELKRLKSARGAAGTTSEVQDKWHAYLRGAGYQVEVCVGWEVARDCILRYLGRNSYR